MNLVRFVAGLLLAVACAAPPARGEPARTAGVRVEGQAYVRLADWAGRQGLASRWLKAEESLQLSDGSFRALLTIDSRVADINGLDIWLSFPVVLRGGTAYVAQSDLDHTLLPILRPPRLRPGTKVLDVCLDAGHGGKDPGYCVGRNQEKKFTLLLAQEVRAELTRRGFKVMLTRRSDRFVDLPVRPALANRQKADLFLSLHFNAAATSRSTVQGAQVFCLTPAGASSTNTRGEGGDSGWCPGNRQNENNVFLAYQVQKALVKNLGVQDRGVRRARFAVLRDAAMPAILVEAGFMSHPAEGRKIFTAAYRRQLAEAVADGVVAYRKAVEPAGTRSEPRRTEAKKRPAG